METPIELKAVCTFIENGLSFLLQLFHQVTDIPCRVTNDTQPLKEKSQVLQSCTKKKRLYDGSRLNCFLVCSCLPVLSCCFYFMRGAHANVKVTALNLVATWQK